MDAAATCPAMRDAADPFAFFEALRSRGDGRPVWDDSVNAWLVYDFDQVAAGQRDERRFANAYVHATETLKTIKGGGANITLSQGTEHDRLRRFHLKLLSPANVERYRVGHVVPIITAALDRIADEARIDATAALADYIPPRVICSMLGMPNDDEHAMQRLLVLNHEIVRLIESGYRNDTQRERALAASAELNEVLLPYVRLRREQPADDFLSRVWREAPDFGIDLDEEAALGLCRELYFAGSDTTVYGISNILWTLFSRPEVLARVRQDRGKALNALIEEGMRLLDVVIFRHRICIEDTEIAGVSIQAGQTVFLINAAANRDPARYSCPADVDLDRRVPTDHLAFGRGTRSCVGAQLARVEMRELVGQLLDRFPNARLDPDAPQPAFEGFFMRSMRPVRLQLRG